MQNAVYVYLMIFWRNIRNAEMIPKNVYYLTCKVEFRFVNLQTILYRLKIIQA
jgi:hypothetical protein